VYPGIDPVFLTAEASDPTSDPPYLLHSASGDARDNTDLVLSAFARIAHRQVRLSIVSSPTALRASLQLRAEALGMADRVDIVGWVTDEELRDLYRGAVLFVHPSKYEGFAGYPALEAMALGTPVVALKAPGASEALGGVSRLVPREDAGLLADAIDALLDNDSLRGALGSAGRERAQALTWESTAAAFAAVFARLLG
jgi:glycosyltransferase involved in cell wall biosynthesis